MKLTKRRQQDQAVAVLLISPDGIPLVRDSRKGVDQYWKAPGGHVENGEMVEHAAVREIREEISEEIANDLKAEDLYPLDKKSPGKETVTYFFVRVPTLRGIRSEKDLDLRIFSAEEILCLPNFLSTHHEAFEKVLIDEVMRKSHCH